MRGVHLTAVSPHVQCRFSGRVAVAPMRVSDTEVECMAPENTEEGLVEVSLVWESAAAQASNAVDYFYHAHVSIDMLLPSRGSTGGESLVTILGAGFRNQGLVVMMGPRKISKSDMMWTSSTQVLLTVPPSMETGKLAVEASVNDGADFTRTGREYLYEAGATVEALIPSRGVSGKSGQVVTVVGKHFAESAELSCRFGDSLAVSGLYVSSTIVACMAPARGAGAVMVSASNNGQDEGPSDVHYDYVAWQEPVFRTTPSAGPVSGGTTVVVEVSGTQMDMDVVRCKFGPEIVGSKRLNVTTVECVTPWMTKEGVVMLTLLDGIDGAEMGGGSPFTFFEAPRVMGVSPCRGVLVGGTTVLVTGSGFRDGEGLQCRLGESKVTTKTGAVWFSSTMVSCVAPGAADGTSGPVTVEVSLNDGADFTSDGKMYTYEMGAT
ncbi:MAG: IPT/TIG domain-containing protein, partial [Promethearchaeia archaeon]